MSVAQLLADLQLIRCTVHDALDAVAQAADSDDSAPMDAAAALAARKARLDPVLSRFAIGYRALHCGTDVRVCHGLTVTVQWCGLMVQMSSACELMSCFESIRIHRCTCDCVRSRSKESANG
jgi:hypothetical protein